VLRNKPKRARHVTIPVETLLAAGWLLLLPLHRHAPIRSRVLFACADRTLGPALHFLFHATQERLCAFG
jgi:hypothetical protein